MESLARVGMLVQRGAVEVRQRVRVGREMAGHPVQDHFQAGAVGGPDETAQRLG
jgi:hypothetical protein